jgi:hypothetical protein
MARRRVFSPPQPLLSRSALRCPGKPDTYPWRCTRCPVLAWPPAKCSRDALQDFGLAARCPHDWPGGPVPLRGEP